MPLRPNVANIGGVYMNKMNVQQLNNPLAKKRKNNEWFYFKQNLPLTLLALPTLIVIFIFKYLPLYGLIIPFKDYNVRAGIINSPWVGFKNFEFLFKSKDILYAVRNTIGYNLVFIFVGMFISVVLALMLYDVSKRSVKVYQTSMLVPYFMSWVVVAYIINALLDMENGIFNQVLNAFGIESVMWYNEPGPWPFIIILTYIFKSVGYNAVVYYAALSGIDSSYFEAAQIDGASRFKQIIHISLPHLKPIIMVMIILNIGKIFYGDFGLFYNVTLNSSLIYSATDVIDTYVYRALMEIGDLGVSATTGFCQSVLGFILVVTTNYISGKVEDGARMF